MDGPLPAQRALDLSMEGVHSAVEALLKITTQEQHVLKPNEADDGEDDASKVILAEFLLDLLFLLTKSILMALKRTSEAASGACALSALSNTLPQAFAEALNITQGVHSGSFQSLTNLITLQVVESVKSALTARTGNAEPVIDVKNICPERLNAMVQHAGKMMSKDSAENMKTESTFQRGRQRDSIVTALHSFGENCKNAGGMPAKSMSPGSYETCSIKSPEESILLATSNTVQDILKRETHDLIQRLLTGVPAEEFEQLESGSLLDIRIAADDIAALIVRRTKNMEESGAGKPPLTEVIKSFFATQFARAFAFRIMVQVKAEFFDHGKVKSSQSVQSFISCVDSVFQPKRVKHLDGADESSWINDISSDNDQVFTENLTNVLTNYSDMLSYIPERREIPHGHTWVFLTPPRATVHAHTRDKVQRFSGLMKWWLKTQADPLSVRVTQLTVEEAPTPASCQEEPGVKEEGDKNVSSNISSAAECKESEQMLSPSPLW